MSAALFGIFLTGATFLVALVAGFLFAFSVVAMPGLKRLDDAGFVRAFQAIDGVIQNNHPLFMLVWVGSVILLMISVAAGFGQLGTVHRTVLIVITVIYIAGVHIPTALINIPRNNAIQKVDVDTLNRHDLHEARRFFEDTWNRSNRFRTIMAAIAALALVVMPHRL
jgi:uncharacterized membrane protein